MHCGPIQLSEREKQVVQARARGLGYKQIASELQLSVNTIKTHFSRIFVKLDIQCSLELLQRMQAEDCAHCPFATAARRGDRGQKLKAIAKSRSLAE